jgi:hypothetical protein
MRTPLLLAMLATCATASWDVASLLPQAEGFSPDFFASSSTGQWWSALWAEPEAQLPPPARSSCQAEFGMPCTSWYDASQADALEEAPMREFGSRVLSWRDRSGLANHLRAHAAAPPPVSLPGVAGARFHARASLRAGGGAARGEGTACLAVRNFAPGAGAAPAPLWAFADGTGAYVNGTELWAAAAPGAPWLRSAFSAAATPFVFCVASRRDSHAAYWNGGLAAALSAPARAGEAERGALALGGGREGAYAADLVEFVAFSAALTATEAAALAFRLLAKWAAPQALAAPPPRARAPGAGGWMQAEDGAPVDVLDPLAVSGRRGAWAAAGTLTPELPGAHLLAWRADGAACSLWLGSESAPLLESAPGQWRLAAAQLPGPTPASARCAPGLGNWALDVYAPDNRALGADSLGLPAPLDEKI